MNLGRARRPRSDVPDAELSVLKRLWERGSATVRDLAQQLYRRTDASSQATVQKLLERLEERGCVRRRREGRANVYAAVVSREDLLDQRLRDAADKLCAGSLTPLITQLLDGRRLTAEEVRTVRELLDRADRARGEERK